MTVHTNLCISENYINKQSNFEMLGKEKQLCPRESTKGKVELCDHQLGLCDTTSEACYEKKLTVTCAPKALNQVTVDSSLSPCLQVSAATQQQVAESKVSVIKEEPVPSRFTGILSSSYSEDIICICDHCR